MDYNNCNQNAHCFNHNNMNMARGGRYNCGNCNRMMPNTGARVTSPQRDCGCTNTEKNGCNPGTEHVDHMAPGMCFVPWQKWHDIFDMEQALNCGTIFKELYKPYIGRGCGQ